MENSKVLLTKAIQAINEAGISDASWEIGGGTVLAHYFNHRLSKDIDIFLSDPQLLSVLSPRFNNVTEDALDYDEMTNYISLTYPAGKVDFIISPQITAQKPVKQEFFGYFPLLESPIEIVIKKIFHRGEQVLPRDLFDLATVYTFADKTLLKKELLKIKNQALDFFERVQKGHFDQYSEIYKNMLLPGAKAIAGNENTICKEIAKSFLATLSKEKPFLTR